MSTTTWESSGSGSPKLINVILFVILAITVVVSGHAVIRHGNDALAIRDCLDKNGDFQIWKSLTDANKFFRICQFDRGQFGMQIVQSENGTVYEKTAFIKGDGTWGALMKYLGKIATKFNGHIP